MLECCSSMVRTRKTHQRVSTTRRTSLITTRVTGTCHADGGKWHSLSLNDLFLVFVLDSSNKKKHSSRVLHNAVTIVPKHIYWVALHSNRPWEIMGLCGRCSWEFGKHASTPDLYKKSINDKQYESSTDSFK